MTKVAFIEAFLPEMKGGKCDQTGRGEGSTARVAIARAMGQVLKGIKGKRVSVIQARITLHTKAEETDDHQVEEHSAQSEP